MQYHWINLAVIAAYLLLMLVVGVFFVRGNKTADDYFTAGGRLPWWVVSMSIYATMFSSITFLSVPALVYHTDCRYLLKATGIIILVPVVLRYYLPFFRRLKLTSAYEYLEVRFNLSCRIFASAAFTLFMIARTAIVAYLPAVAISAVTGLDFNASIAIVTLVTILYCTIGGITAVVWSDFVQSVILIVSTAAMFVYLIAGTEGGFLGFIAKGMEAGKFTMVDLRFDWSEPVLWVVLVGGLVENLVSYTSDQCIVQRYMTTADEAAAAKSIKLNGLVSFVNCVVFFFLGVALWTFYQSNPALQPDIQLKDQVVPWFIARSLPVGFSGLVLAAVAAATMSTLSTNLNSAATAITTDFYTRLFRGRNPLKCGRVVTFLTGIIGGALALVLANIEVGLIYNQFLRFLGVLTGGLASLFFMGRFMKFVNGRGAFIGLVANYTVCFSLDMTKFEGKPHILLYGAIGMVSCLAVSSLASVVFSDKKKG